MTPFDVYMGAQATGEPKSKKARAESSGPLPAKSATDLGDGWQKVTSMRPPPASAGRVCGGPSADDSRTEVVRGFEGPIPRDSLTELLAPMLKRLGGRFDLFGGRPAAASAPGSVVGVGASSPPGTRRWNGFNLDLKSVLCRGPRTDKVTVLEQKKGRAQVADILAKVGSTYVLKRVGQARFSGDGSDSRYEWGSLELEFAFRNCADDLRAVLGVSSDEVSIVGAEAEQVEQAAGDAQDDQEM